MLLFKLTGNLAKLPIVLVNLDNPTLLLIFTGNFEILLTMLVDVGDVDAALRSAIHIYCMSRAWLYLHMTGHIKEKLIT